MSRFALVLSSPLLFAGETPTMQRQAQLGAYFDPPPGQPLEISKKAIARQAGKSPQLLSGQIMVKPPKGQCLRIRRDLDEPDKKICKPEPISWKLHELDNAGRLQRLVISGSPDEGTLLSWPTPYRIANFVPFGEKDKGEDQDIAVLSCERREQREDVKGRQTIERSIVLSLADGRRWMIELPAFDTKLPRPKVKIKKEEAPPKADPHAEKPAEEHAEKPADPHGPAPKEEKSPLAKILSGEKLVEAKPPYYFRITGENVYEMPSTFFHESDAPSGFKGKCRYLYKGAPYDHDSGVIECYDTSSMDAVYVHLTCTGPWEPRIDPAASP